MGHSKPHRLQHSQQQHFLRAKTMDNHEKVQLLSPESKKAAAEADEDEVNLPLYTRILNESKKLWIVAGPAIFSRLSTFGVIVITQAFIGHVSSVELAAYSVIVTVTLRFVNGIILGMASALETLCGQAYGARQYHMVGIYLQRSWIVLLGSTVVLLPIYFFTTPVLLLLGQDRNVAEVAGKVALWFIPISFSYVFSYTFQMYFQSQSKNFIITYLAAFSLSLHLLFSWLMVSKLGMGLAGAMSSMVLAMWIPIFGQFVFTLCGGCKDTWKGFSLSAFSDLWSVFKLSLSSGVMICLEHWYYTILILLTGHLKNAEVVINALSICLNINGWEMMISLGFLAAAGVRVANELGAGNAKAAKFSIVVAVITSLLIGFVLFVMFLIFGGRIAYIFTNDLNVVRAVDDLSPLLAFSILLNSVQPVLSGVAVGAGWQNVVAYVNVTCYYLIGIPLGVVLGYFIGYQVKGIWMGMMLGTTVQTIVLLYITCRTDWDIQVNNAQARLNKWVLPSPDDQNGGKQKPCQI